MPHGKKTESKTGLPTAARTRAQPINKACGVLRFALAFFFFYLIVEMDQLTEGLIQESYRRSREVFEQIEKLGFKRNGILPDTKPKKRKKDELEETIKQLQIERGDLWAYGVQLRDPRYSAWQG